jgi:hypothetical protein
MAYLFPKLAACNFTVYGHTGSAQPMNGICTLPLNNINEKTYFALWVILWLIIGLTIAT